MGLELASNNSVSVQGLTTESKENRLKSSSCRRKITSFT